VWLSGTGLLYILARKQREYDALRDEIEQLKAELGEGSTDLAFDKGSYRVLKGSFRSFWSL
jgi:hypothetical protein